MMRVCLAVTEVLGAHRNGGIGTATSNLSILLSDAGHDVTLLNCSNLSFDKNNIWTNLYRRFGISIVNLSSDDLQISPGEMRTTMAVYEYVRSRAFDVIIFQDWLGLGYASTVAKRAGLSLSGTKLVVNTHGSAQWVHDVAHVVPDSRRALRQMHIERRAVELADVVISPSHYMVEWMRRSGWSIPTECRVIQNYLQGLRLAGLRLARSSGSVQHGQHLAFFGRLERRKGLFLFLEALRTPPLANLTFKLSFVGRAADATASQIADWLTTYRPDLLPGVTFLDNKTADEAREYLIDTHALAVIPSLSDNLPCVIWECIEDAVPFVSTINGGIPELVPPDAHARLLVEPTPTALADRLVALLADPTTPRLGHRLAPEEVGSSWLSWLEEARAQPDKSTPTITKKSYATVIMLHRGSIDQLTRRLQELTLQTSPYFNLIIISEEPEPNHNTLVTKALAPRWIQSNNRSLKSALELAPSHSYPIILCDTTASISPSLVEELRRGADAFPNAIVSAHYMCVSPESDGANSPFLRKDVPRFAPTGGDTSAGAYDNVFGEFPILIPGSAAKVDWLPSTAESSWGLLAAWSIFGGAVEVLPSALACRESGLERMHYSPVREHDEVLRIYMEALPSRLIYLATPNP